MSWNNTETIMQRKRKLHCICYYSVVCVLWSPHCSHVPVETLNTEFEREFDQICEETYVRRWDFLVARLTFSGGGTGTRRCGLVTSITCKFYLQPRLLDVIIWLLVNDLQPVTNLGSVLIGSLRRHPVNPSGSCPGRFSDVLYFFFKVNNQESVD